MSSGNKVLIINGHTFRREVSVNGATSRWCCNEPNDKKCDVYAHINEKFELVCLINAHNHEPTLCQERCYDSAPEYLEDDHDVILFMESQSGRTIMQYDEYHYRKASESRYGERWICASTKKCAAYVTLNDSNEILTNSVCHDHPPTRQELKHETDDSDTAVVITSRKGKEMLLFRNYTYRRQYVKGNKSRWVCSTLKNCRAAVFTDSNNVIVSIQDKHEHDPPKYYLNPNHVLEALREPLVFESD
ncbi:unnamed protein product [Pieris brassicae]|uniref:FLYWCH-type domain-containing protein n=1 Tax=Pieris brassicae TaxID=7116 RepID=A0A9P0WZS9_PIEBR|nr:unnamed protein product [Pieris brassicae]